MEKKMYVLWKWNNEVYEVLADRNRLYVMKNIKSGESTKVEHAEVIVIHNM